MSEKSDKRINEIIEAAICEFIEKGFEDASMENIASRANMSKGGLYHHFNSKAEILLAVNMKFMEPINDIIGQVEKNVSVVDGLKQFIANYLSYWNNHRRELSLYFFTMNISFSNQRIIGYYQVFAHQIFDCFEAHFIKGQLQGEFKKRDARSHAVALISCLDGYLAYMLIDPSLQLDKIIVEIQKTFIDDLLK